MGIVDEVPSSGLLTDIQGSKSGLWLSRSRTDGNPYRSHSSIECSLVQNVQDVKFVCLKMTEMLLSCVTISVVVGKLMVIEVLNKWFNFCLIGLENLCAEPFHCQLAVMCLLLKVAPMSL